MKYESLLEADCRVIDTVEADIVSLGRHLQLHATLNVMPGFIVFRRSSDTTPGLTPTRLVSRDESILVGGYETLLLNLLLNIAAFSLLTVPRYTQR